MSQPGRKPPRSTARPPWRSNSPEWRALAAQVYAEETHCYLCRWPVDTSGAVPYNHDWSPTVDHVIPPEWCRYLFGDPRGLDRTNVRLAHRKCNNRKGMGPPPLEPYPPPPGQPPTRLPTPSRDW